MDVDVVPNSKVTLFTIFLLPLKSFYRVFCSKITKVEGCSLDLFKIQQIFSKIYLHFKAVCLPLIRILALST